MLRSLARKVRRRLHPPLEYRGVPGPPEPDTRPAVEVVIPVYGAAAELARCLDSVEAHTDLERDRVLIVLDGPGQEEAEAVARGFAARRPAATAVVANARREGFVKSANRGLAASARDVVLLNSDTVVTAGWLEKLKAAAASDVGIATATPFSNDATLCSLPRFLEANPLPAGHDAHSFARLVERVSARHRPRLPTGVGLCLYVKRRALQAVGLFDEVHFGLGYGEESDFCVRALHAGFVHVLDDATFVQHAGGRSFGLERERRQKEAERVLRRLHPRYLPTIAEFIREDPLRAVREPVLQALQAERA